VKAQKKRGEKEKTKTEQKHNGWIDFLLIARDSKFCQFQTTREIMKLPTKKERKPK
jgi:hypothetical protein